MRRQVYAPLADVEPDAVSRSTSIVMPGLGPGIHELRRSSVRKGGSTGRTAPLAAGKAGFFACGHLH